MDLSGKVAIITGGAGGIGLGAAECLAREGAALMIVDNNHLLGSQTASRLQQMFGRISFCHADISKVEDIRNAVEETLRSFGALDILVNNAGIQTFGGPLDTSEETWDRTMNINLKAHWLVSKVALPHMLRRGRGSIINVSSVQGLASQANVMAYATSKHAVIGLTRAMAVDLAAQGIRVNCVCPGTVNTPMLRWVIEQDQHPDRLEQLLNRMHPIGRMGTPQEIGEVIAFLASDRASFMTGSIITVDGGLLVPIAGSPNQ